MKIKFTEISEVSSKVFTETMTNYQSTRAENYVFMRVIDWIIT